GFLIAVLILGKTTADLSVAAGWNLFFASLPIAIVGLISGIAQGKTAVAAIHMTGKQPDASGKGITMTALVETYAILALLTSILLWTNI
ncbi:MAG: permease, partial [Eubacteriales bacterium]